MSLLIAIATKDGKVIQEHFGRCNRYCIVEIDNGEYRFTGFREVEPPCNGGEHTVEALVEAARILEDCSYVIVGQIGMGAQQILSEHQISAYVYKGFVEDAISIIMKMKGR